MHTDSIFQKAAVFLQSFYDERGSTGLEQRLGEVAQELQEKGTYTHTFEELAYGSRVAWRNSNRCIGRLFWKSLTVLDCRGPQTDDSVRQALTAHLQLATNGGKIKPAISIFSPMGPDGSVALRIWNKQLIRYAGYRQSDGSVVGDPLQLSFTEMCRALGWSGTGTAFDLLPVVYSLYGGKPSYFTLPTEWVMEVLLEHPEYPWLRDMQLRWHALPVISDMVLEIGGILYPAAPFNGWYMLTEIGSRNLGDESRYNLLPAIADKLGLDRKSSSVLWKDRALVVLNEAVRFSFNKSGVTLTDHHEASKQFMHFMRNEKQAGREVKADWSWIVPPMSGSSLSVFHQAYDNQVLTPNFFYNHDAWGKPSAPARCPFHVDSLSG